MDGSGMMRGLKRHGKDVALFRNVKRLTRYWVICNIVFVDR